MPKHFVAKSIKHIGALHKQLGIPQGKNIPMSTLHAAAKKGGVLAKRANLAITLHKMHGG